MKEEFRLTQVERESAAWLKLKAYMTKRLAEQRSKNDGDLPLELTAKTRGRIAELKELLTLGDEPKPVVAEPDMD